MKHFFTSIFWLSFFASLLGPGSLLAQRQQTIVYDINGSPERIAHEVVVRFDAAEMRTDMVNDPYQANGTLDNFISPKAMDAITSATGRDMRSIEAWKVFPQMTTEQTTTLN